MKRQPSEWEKIIGNKQLTKDQYPKYIHRAYSSISEKQTTPKYVEDLNRHILKDRRQTNT